MKPLDLASSKREPLDPLSRISEALFGLIMVLTFTGSLSVAEADHNEVRTMLIGALGCNIAWGVIDAVFYLMAILAERGEAISTLRAVRLAADSTAARELLVEALPLPVARVATPEELDSIVVRLHGLPPPPERARLTRRDWISAVEVFLFVFLATFPVAIPFLFMSEPGPALRASNAVAIVLLFGLGFAFAKIAGRKPWATGTLMVVLGAALVSMTIALGG